MLRKTALITGGNSGIGFAVAERLLEWDPSIILCLACRNQTKAEEARNRLLLHHPTSQVDLVPVDVSSIKSIYNAAAQIKERYHHIDLVYLNAGIMPVSNVNWSHFWTNVFSSNCLEMFRTGSGLLQQVDEVTEDGFKKIFTTNLFGHFILIKEIQSLLGDPHGTSQIIWTSSSNAKRQAFSFNDIQHAKGNEPYSSSKYASDLVSVAINNQHNDKGIYSHTTCPGLVMSNITYGILPQWVWYLLLPIILLLRLFIGNMTHTARNGAEALVWLAKQKPEQLDPMSKYHSMLSVTGRRYTEPSKLDVSLEEALKLYNMLDKMQEELRLFIGNMTHTARNGAEALVWLAKQKPEQLDPMSKYHSMLSVTGRRYTEPSKLDVSLEDALKLYNMLDKMQEEVRVKYKSKVNSES